MLKFIENMEIGGKRIDEKTEELHIKQLEMEAKKPHSMMGSLIVTI